MADAVSVVGARLSLTGAKASIDSLLATADAYDKLDASIARTAATAEKAGITMDAAMASQAKVTAGATDATVAADAGVVSQTKRTAVAKDANVVTDAGTLALARQTKATRDAEQAIKDTEKAHKNLVSTVSSISSGPFGKMAKWGFVGEAVGAGESIKTYQNLNQQMVKLFTMAGVPHNQLSAWTQNAIDLANTYGLKLQDIGNISYRIASSMAGVVHGTPQLLEMTKAVAQFATIAQLPGGTATDYASRMVGSIQNAATGPFALRGAGNAKHTMNLLTAAIGVGDMQPSDLANAIASITGPGQVVGSSLNDELAWLDLMTKHGFQASRAATLISHSQQQFASQTSQGTKALALFGIVPGQLADMMRNPNQGIGAIGQAIAQAVKGGLKPPANFPSTTFGGQRYASGMPSALATLKNYGIQMNPSQYAALASGQPLTGSNYTDILQEIMSKTFGGARQQLPAGELITNTGEFNSILAQINKDANPANFAAYLKAQMNTPAQQQKIALEHLQTLGYEIGKTIDPGWLKFLHGMEDFLGFLTKNKAALDGLIITFGALTAVGTAAFAAKHVLSWVDTFKHVGSIVGLGGGGVKDPLLGANTGALEAQTAATIRLTEVMGAEGLKGGGLGGLGGGAGGVAKTVAGGAGAEELVAGGIAGTGLTAGSLALIGAAGAAAGYFGAKALAAHSSGVMHALNTGTNATDNFLSHIPGLGNLHTNTYYSLSQIAAMGAATGGPLGQGSIHTPAPYGSISAALKAFGVPSSSLPIEGTASSIPGHGIGKTSKAGQAQQYWDAALSQAVNSGHYNFLNAMLQSGTQMPADVWTSLFGKNGPANASTQQIIAAATQQHNSAAAAQALRDLATADKNQKATDFRNWTQTVDAQQHQKKIAGQQLQNLAAATNAHTQIANWLTNGAKPIMGPATTGYGQTIQNSENKFSNDLAKTLASKLDPQAKDSKVASDANKIAANLLKEAAKSHGTAAAALKSAADAIIQGVSGLNNLKLNVNLSPTAVTNAVTSSIKGASARH